MHRNPRTLILLAVMAPLAASPARADIQARIDRIGILGGGNHPIREDCWTTVEVLLTNPDQSLFAGTLQLERADRDGDIAVAVTEVALTPGQTRPYLVYAVPHSLRNTDRLHLKLYNEAGQQVKILDETGVSVRAVASQLIERVGPGETIIVDLSEPRWLPHLRFMTRNDPELGQDRHVRVWRGEPSHLPDRWHGLEMVDVIVWDDPNLSVDKVRPEQVRAVRDWVYAGGRLLISSGQNWQTLMKSELAEILPVRISSVRQSEQGIELRPLATNAPKEFFTTKPIARCVAQPRGGVTAGITSIRRADGKGLEYRRQYGRGSVTFVGVPLYDLFKPMPVRAPDSPEVAPEEGQSSDTAIQSRALFGPWLSVPPPPPKPQDTYYQSSDIYRPILTRIGFQQNAGLYLFFSFVFAIGYVLSATGGVWWWLGRRKARHHAWSCFGIVAGVAAALGLLAVWGLCGVTRKLHDVQIVDSWANLTPAPAQSTCLFGLRTPTQTQVDVRLPVQSAVGEETSGPITVLPPALTDLEGAQTYVAPTKYQVTEDGRKLEDVTVRATLKEFAGTWSGTLAGGIQAKLVSSRKDADFDRFQEGSFIRNSLGVDLRGCLLLDTERDNVALSLQVRCYTIGDLKNGAEFRGFDNWYRKKDKGPVGNAITDAVAEATDEQTDPFRESDLTKLDKMTDDWVGQLQALLFRSAETTAGPERLEDIDKMLMLLSTFDVFRPPAGKIPLRREGGRRLGCLHQLSRNTAILIGFSDEPGPARLEVDGTSLQSSKSLTMYRFLIPVERN